jgi:tetratricopeptide (TPR) repeat protein
MRSGRRARPTVFRIAVAMAGAALGLGLPSARAEDVVTLRATPPARSARLAGEILDYTGRELRIRTATGRERVVRPEQVESIVTQHCPEHTAGDALFADGDYRLAADKYRAAIDTDREVRPWVRRQILSQLVWCYQNTGQWEQAGEIFLSLVARDFQTPYFDCIPLAWIGTQPSELLRTKAQVWLATADDPIAGLLGASHLLATAARPAATARLRQLAQDQDPRIAFLAQTQLWRAEAAQATPADLARWSRYVESGDEMLRAGPYYILGASLVAHDPQAAALALLELPIMYPRHGQLATAALLGAGGCLQTAGRPQQAAALYRELIRRDQASSESAEAQRRLDRLGTPQSSQRPSAAKHVGNTPQ